MGLDDEVMLRYTFKGNRLLRKAVRYLAGDCGTTETDIVYQALMHYRPVLETMSRIRKGDKYVSGKGYQFYEGSTKKNPG